MKPERIQIKLFHTTEADLKPLIPTFHDWISETKLPGLLIDVADYRHVENGPGLLLMGHDGDYGVRNEHGRSALSYKHKRDWPSVQLGERVTLTLGRALAAEERLQQEQDQAGFTQPFSEIEISFPDRLNAPNTAEQFTTHVGEISTAVEEKLGQKLDFSHVSTDPRQMFAVRATINRTSL